MEWCRPKAPKRPLPSRGAKVRQSLYSDIPELAPEVAPADPPELCEVESRLKQIEEEGGFGHPYCDVCKEVVTDPDVHFTSTVHNFNLQHRAPIYYGIPESNMGYKLLQKMGWNDEKGLGKEQQGRVEPVPTKLKRDRDGLGLRRDNPQSEKAKVTHFISKHENAPTVGSERQAEEAVADLPANKRARHVNLKKAAIAREKSERRREQRIAREVMSDVEYPTEAPPPVRISNRGFFGL